MNEEEIEKMYQRVAGQYLQEVRQKTMGKKLTVRFNKDDHIAKNGDYKMLKPSVFEEFNALCEKHFGTQFRMTLERTY